MKQAAVLALYFLPFVAIFAWYAGRRRRHYSASVATWRESEASGLTEPPSLHPVIDPNRCVGCAACINVCPEMPGHKVLGLIDGKANLISPTDCIGHGACLQACPVDAITLVFGTERRGVDIPHVNADFQTNVPGVYIAGELGGMGLIRNAIEQGRQAMESIAGTRQTTDEGQLDVLIVGAGPAGFSASLAAKEQGLRCVTVEQDSLGGTVANFPRGKLVMTAPARLPIVGDFRFRETTKEKLIDYLASVERETGVEINYGERVETIERDASGFSVQTTRGIYRSRCVLLAIGRRGTPRKLGVPGEDLTKVTYRLIDPEQYAGQRVLVVGGGDSALEAACSITEVPGTEVTLSYRSEAFTRAKAKNRDRVQALSEAGRLKIILPSNVAAITDNSVEVVREGRRLSLDNDSVIINAGGILPSQFLRSIGVDIDTKYGTA